MIGFRVLSPLESLQINVLNLNFLGQALQITWTLRATGQEVKMTAAPPLLPEITRQFVANNCCFTVSSDPM